MNNINKNIIVLDVETNCEKGEIIQLAYMVFDEQNNKIKTFDKYVKNKSVSRRSISINHITNEILELLGEQLDKIMDEFIDDLSTCEYVVGHNIESDCRVINKNFCPDFADLNLFENKKMYCTMKESKKFCDLKNIKGHIKPPKLEELYYKLFGENPHNCHDALSDVKYTAECFFYLRLLHE